jgi:hypothetical protein
MIANENRTNEQLNHPDKLMNNKHLKLISHQLAVVDSISLGRSQLSSQLIQCVSGKSLHFCF